MMHNTAAPTHEMKKLHLEAVVLFASCNIPEVDAATLKQFLELANAGGTFGTISHEQILKKMYMVLKYIPDACPHSLKVLMDLLEIKSISPSLQVSDQLLAHLPISQVDRITLDMKQTRVSAI